MKYLLTLATTSLLMASAHAGTPRAEYRLRLYHTHTNQHLDIVYRHGETYLTNALSQLDRFLRDHRTGEVHHFDPRLFDLLADLTRVAGRPDAEIHVICGYRAPASNEFLRTHTSGVARQSLHMLAEAIDIRLPEVKTSVFRQRALELGRGGVATIRSRTLFTWTWAACVAGNASQK